MAETPADRRGDAAAEPEDRELESDANLEAGLPSGRSGTVEEELEVLNTHLTELSRLCRRKFSELSPRADVAAAREEVDTLRGRLEDLEKRIHQRMERVEGMKVTDEVEHLVQLTERSGELRREIQSEVRKVEILAGEMERFTRDRSFLEDTIGKVVDLATTVERSSGAVDRHLKEMNDAVLSLQRELARAEDRLGRIEQGPGPHEEHLVEMETRLKLLEELSERIEHLTGDRLGELKGDVVALGSRVAKVESSVAALESRTEKRQLEWEETMRKEFSLLDGRLINIEKALVRRLEQVERLEKQQEKHMESMEDLVAAVRDTVGTKRSEVEGRDKAFEL